MSGSLEGVGSVQAPIDADDRKMSRRLRIVACALSAVNALLAFNFFPLVPFLGWLNYGRAAWATAWIPDVMLLLLLPAGYFLYWHFWFLVAIPALFATVALYRRGGGRQARLLVMLNAATVLLFWLVRTILAILGIHPDIV